MKRGQSAARRRSLPLSPVFTNEHEEPAMNQYLLSIIQPDGPPPPPATLGPIMQAVGAVMQELKSSGAWVFNGGLQPASDTTVVRLKDGDLLVTDGPYAEAKEHIGGFVVVKAQDRDGALAWARKLARAITLPIEVRPFQWHDGGKAP
jgi:hypothetical protein